MEPGNNTQVERPHARWNLTSLTSGKLACVYEACVVCIGSVWDASGAYMVHPYYYIIDCMEYIACVVCKTYGMYGVYRFYTEVRMYGACGVYCVCGVCICVYGKWSMYVT